MFARIFCGGFPFYILPCYDCDGIPIDIPFGWEVRCIWEKVILNVCIEAIAYMEFFLGMKVLVRYRINKMVDTFYKDLIDNKLKIKLLISNCSIHCNVNETIFLFYRILNIRRALTVQQSFNNDVNYGFTPACWSAQSRAALISRRSLIVHPRCVRYFLQRCAENLVTYKWIIPR